MSELPVSYKNRLFESKDDLERYKILLDRSTFNLGKDAINHLEQLSASYHLARAAEILYKKYREEADKTAGQWTSGNHYA